MYIRYMMQNQQMSKLYHCVYALTYHLVIVTKYRRACLMGPMLERFKELAADRYAGWGGKLLEANGELDHVHLLVSLPPNLDLSRFVNNLKTTTSRLLRRDLGKALAKHYRQPVLWSQSYCILSAGGAPLSIIKQYIENQAGAE
jgi:putative transposase